MKYIIVYGSLKKDGFNFDRFSQYGRQIFISDITLDGYELHDLGPYPAVCKGNGTIKGELHAVSDEAFEQIYNMELGAGYTTQAIKLSNSDLRTLGSEFVAIMFIMDKKNISKHKLVRH